MLHKSQLWKQQPHPSPPAAAACQVRRRRWPAPRSSELPPNNSTPGGGTQPRLSFRFLIVLHKKKIQFIFTPLFLSFSFLLYFLVPGVQSAGTRMRTSPVDFTTGCWTDARGLAVVDHNSSPLNTLSLYFCPQVLVKATFNSLRIKAPSPTTPATPALENSDLAAAIVSLMRAQCEVVNDPPLPTPTIIPPVRVRRWWEGRRRSECFILAGETPVAPARRFDASTAASQLVRPRCGGGGGRTNKGTAAEIHNNLYRSPGCTLRDRRIKKV